MTLPVMLAGNPAIVPVTVTNNTGVAATLFGFIDFNGDGKFDGPNEAVTAPVPSNTNGPVNLTFAVPFTASTSLDLGARFRLSTDTTLGPDGVARNGEVEDYLLHIQVFDLALQKTWQPASPIQSNQRMTSPLQ